MKTIIAFIKQNWKYDLVLIILALIVFSPLTYSASVIDLEVTDYGPHTSFAIQFVSQLKGGEATRASIYARGGWQLLIIALHNLTGLSYDLAPFVAAMLCVLASVLIIFHIFKPTLEKRGGSPWWGLGIALGLNLVTPIFLLAPLDHQQYLGYIGMITYHNPTSIMLRPVAILQFVYALACFREKSSPWRQVLFVAFLSLLGLYIKPNYALCILPAMGLIVLYRLLKRQTINWRMTIFGFVLPSVVLLAVQYLAVFGDPQGEAAMAIRPFEAMSLYSDYLLPKFLLSIIFPLLIGILYFKDAIKDDRMILAWLVFLFGFFFAYIIAEGGRLESINYLWGSQFATWILFGLSLLLLIEKAPTSSKWKIWTPALAASLHLIFGIVYYIACLSGQYGLPS